VAKYPTMQSISDRVEHIFGRRCDLVNCSIRVRSFGGHPVETARWGTAVRQCDYWPPQRCRCLRVKITRCVLSDVIGCAVAQVYTQHGQVRLMTRQGDNYNPSSAPVISLISASCGHLHASDLPLPQSWAWVHFCWPDPIQSNMDVQNSHPIQSNPWTSGIKSNS